MMETAVGTDDDKYVVGFDLLESDPRRLQALSIKRRLRPGSTTLLESPKPFPFLAVAPPKQYGAPLDLLTIKVARLPLGEVSANSLREEEIWARAEGLFHSAGEDAVHAWVARAYIQGTPMNELSMGLSDDAKRQQARSLAAEIERFHSSDEAHLDVKPSNVIVTPSRTWLIDFESSRGADQTSSLPMLSTASFASPEQAIPEPGRKVGRPSDIFSWGLTVISMYRRDYHPYCDGPFDLATFQARAAGVPARRDVSTLHLGFIEDVGLREAVLRALAWSPTDRPTATQLLEALDREPGTMIMSMPSTRVLDPADFEVKEPWWQAVRRAAGPAGPFGDRHVPAIVFATAYLGALVVSIVLALVIAGLFWGGRS